MQEWILQFYFYLLDFCDFFCVCGRAQVGRWVGSASRQRVWGRRGVVGRKEEFNRKFSSCSASVKTHTDWDKCGTVEAGDHFFGFSAVDVKRAGTPGRGFSLVIMGFWFGTTRVSLGASDVRSSPALFSLAEERDELPTGVNTPACLQECLPDFAILLVSYHRGRVRAKIPVFTNDWFPLGWGRRWISILITPLT